MAEKCETCLGAQPLPSALAPRGTAGEWDFIQTVPVASDVHDRTDQLGQLDPRMTEQKFPRWKCGSRSAITSAFTFPNVVSGLCRMPL